MVTCSGKESDVLIFQSLSRHLKPVNISVDTVDLSPGLEMDVSRMKVRLFTPDTEGCHKALYRYVAALTSCIHTTSIAACN